MFGWFRGTRKVSNRSDSDLKIFRVDNGEIVTLSPGTSDDFPKSAGLLALHEHGSVELPKGGHLVIERVAVRSEPFAPPQVPFVIPASAVVTKAVTVKVSKKAMTDLKRELRKRLGDAPKRKSKSKRAKAKRKARM